MINRAAVFATQAHQGAYRKGTDIPYIVHPLETAVIVSLITEDEEVIAASLLHDVIEDAGISEEELTAVFGRRVAGFVAEETEDKSRSWAERKAATVEHLKSACREIKILTLGDKLSNMRCTARDYMLIGDRIWERFNEKDKARQGWYYLSVAEELRELEQYPAYQEYEALCKKIFDGRVEPPSFIGTGNRRK